MRFSRNKGNAGNASPSILSVIALVTALLSGALGLVSSVRNYSFRLKSKDTARGRALSLLSAVINDFKNLTEDESDWSASAGVRFMEAKYALYGLELTDVSSGINERFLNGDILKNEEVRRITDEKDAEEIVKYGWIQKEATPEGMKKALAASFSYNDSDDYFPLVNSLPLTNIHYLTERCIAAFLSASGVENAREKGAALFYRARQGALGAAEMANILDVKKDHKVFYLLGNKTAFWNVRYKTEECSVSAVICAVPDKKANGKEIKEYRLLERSVSFD